VPRVIRMANHLDDAVSHKNLQDRVGEIVVLRFEMQVESADLFEIYVS
jgi:hypothetical protein